MATNIALEKWKIYPLNLSSSYRLFLFNATTLEKHVVYQLSKVGKFGEIFTKFDRRSGKEIEKETKFLKNRDVVMVKMLQTKPMVVETFSEYPPLGHFVVRGMHQTVAIGVIKSVEKKDPSGAKVTKSAAKKK
nr:elongation factor 1-alpha-like [Malus domestica]